MKGPIGYGSFSTVYKANDRETSKLVAIKVAKIEDGELEGVGSDGDGDKILVCGRKRLEREIELWKPLDHDNLCKLLDVIVDQKQDQVSFVMEIALGGDLLNLLNEVESLNPERVLMYFRQLCDGVRYLHEKGIVHGDIKLENILLTEEGRIKLGDFGLARKSNDLIKQNCGTVEYAAPELLTDLLTDNSDPFKSDIWSLGVTLYALMYKRFPFDAPAPKLLKARILTAEPIFRDLEECEGDEGDEGDEGESSSIHWRRLVNIAKVLLQKRPEKRPSIEDILKMISSTKLAQA